MDAKKSATAWSLRLIVSALFIVSALAKLSKGHLLDSPYFAISTFEVKQLYPMGFSETFAPFFSRTLIGIELALGLLLLQKNWLKKFIIPVTTLMLLVFIGHLTYVTFLNGGSTGNCGCFGELLPMTPIQAIIKNVVAVGLLVYLYKLLPQHKPQGNFWVLTTVLFASILWIFMLAPIQPPTSNFTVSPMIESTPSDATPTIDSTQTAPPTVETTTSVKDTLKSKTTTVVAEPKKIASGNAQYFPNIDSGKKILCYFVPGCEHCRATAKELTEMRKKDPSFPPLYVLFMNEEAFLIPEFFKEAGATYPYKIIEIIPFWNTLGKNRDTPGVKYFWNGNEIKYYDGIKDNKFNGAELEKYIKKPYSELKK